jgi:hypothetical protein
VLIDGVWLAVKRTDPRAYALYRRHYSAEKGARWRRPGNTNVAAAGETMVLLSQCCKALFVWLKCDPTMRLDGQIGVNCTVFRNEGAGLSSDLIREADELAFQRWPGERHFTYVDDTKIRSSNPGFCFLKAGWTKCGRSKARNLSILERSW